LGVFSRIFPAFFTALKKAKEYLKHDKTKGSVTGSK
jgi:hypothetical protein